MTPMFEIADDGSLTAHLDVLPLQALPRPGRDGSGVVRLARRKSTTTCPVNVCLVTLSNDPFGPIRF